MKSFIVSAVLVVAVVYTAVAYDDPVTGECGKDWEVRDRKEAEIIMAAEYAAHVNSQQPGRQYKDVLVVVLEAYMKDCRWPKYNFTALYAISDCKTSDVDNFDCNPVFEKGVRKCKSYLWIPPGRGGQLESHVCEDF